MHNIDSLYDSLAASSQDDNPYGAVLATRAEQLSKPMETVTPETNNEQVREIFARLEGVATIAVVEDGQPIGLINRNIFMEQYARPFARDLYGRKTCVAFMDKTPLIVSSDTPIETLVSAAVESGGKVLNDGFITTLDGQYQGVGTGFGLVKAMSDIEAEKTRQLLSSINYASLIQQSHLVESDQVLREDIRDYGLIWQPRDVVGGDAYFFRRTAEGIFGCVFDCTGHGVPGAFMTLIVMSFLEQAIPSSSTHTDPAAVLQKLNLYIKRVLRQEDRSLTESKPGEKASNDGLDAAIFVLPKDHSWIRFASARLSLLIAEPGASEVKIIEAEKSPIGYSDTPSDSSWAVHEVPLTPNSLLVIPTDGVIDQIGGPKAISHGRRRLVQYLAARNQQSAAQFCTDFLQSFNEWQGGQKRRDDVTLMAFRTAGRS